MAVRTRSNFKTTKNTIIYTNGAGAITGVLHNGILEDVADSVVFWEDFTTGETSIATAAILTMNATPVELVAAPGAGKIILPIGDIIVKYTYVTAAFATNTTLVVQLGATISNQMPGVIDQAADQIGSFGGVQWNGPAANLENQPLTLAILTGNPTGGGTSSIKVYFKYRIVTL